MKSKQEMIKEAVNKAAKMVPGTDKNILTIALTKVFEEGMFPQDALGFSDEFMEVMYAATYKLFQEEKFDEAANCYEFLRFL